MSHDVQRDCIRIDCKGSWTLAQVDACFAETKVIAIDMRRRLGSIRVLVDRRDHHDQSEAAVARLRIQADRGYFPGDRVAVLVASSLLKAQLRLQLDPVTHQLFMSEAAAEMWLRPAG